MSTWLGDMSTKLAPWYACMHVLLPLQWEALLTFVLGPVPGVGAICEQGDKVTNVGCALLPCKGEKNSKARGPGRPAKMEPPRVGHVHCYSRWCRCTAVGMPWAPFSRGQHL